MTDLTGKLALVTGASRGLGLAICRHLLEAKARVIAVSRSEGELGSLGSFPAGQLGFWQQDVLDSNTHQRIERLEELDILVNNAGGNRPEPFVDVGDALEDLVELNVIAAFRVAQAAARGMRPRGGSIINMSSQMGHVGAANRSVYCMTKHAIEGLTKAMAVELAPMNIRVNAIAPTFIETPLTRPMLEDPDFRADVLGSIPLGRLGDADAVARGVLFLADPANDLITGTSLKIDGGWTAR